MSEPILKAVNVQKSYHMGRTTLKVLRGASLSVAPGEFVAVMGSSGCGKSTLLHVLGALDLPDRGSVTFEGQDIFARGSGRRDRFRNTVFGFVFQFYHLLPELNVLENGLVPCMVRRSILGWMLERRADRQRVADLLDRMGLGDRIKHRPNELSGGERQRVAIVRALANDPRILLADEPTGNLDEATGREILDVLEALNRQGQTIIMVTHDPQVAASAHRIVHLTDGRVSNRKRG